MNNDITQSHAPKQDISKNYESPIDAQGVRFSELLEKVVHSSVPLIALHVMLHFTEQGGRSLRSHQSLPSPCYKRKRALQSTQVMGNEKHTSARNTVSSTLVNMVTAFIVPYQITVFLETLLQVSFAA